jgi:hypothetical protein
MAIVTYPHSSLSNRNYCFFLQEILLGNKTNPITCDKEHDLLLLVINFFRPQGTRKYMLTKTSIVILSCVHTATTWLTTG